MAFLLYCLLGFAVFLLAAKILVERIRNAELVIYRTRVSDFENFLSQRSAFPENDMWAICDENRLPHSKKDIFESFLIVRRRDDVSADRVEDMKLKLLYLSCFQKDIGCEPVINPMAPFLQGGSRYIVGQNSVEKMRQISSLVSKIEDWSSLQKISLSDARLYLDTIDAERAPPLKCEGRWLFLVAETVLEIGGSVIKAAFLVLAGVGLYAFFTAFK